MIGNKFNMILSLSIVVMLFTQSFIFALEDKQTVNVSNVREAKILSALSIIDGFDEATYNPSSMVTRAELTVYITKLLGMYDNVKDTKNKLPFSDVKIDYWASQSIAVASSLGIIKGFADGTFMPEETVTYEQATKFILSTLGYDIYAQQKGGYPYGYLSVAAEKGILKNVIVRGGLSVNLGDVVTMLYNALEVELVIQTGFSENSNRYIVNENKTIMSEKLHVYKSSGKLTATSITKLTGPSSLSDDEVIIDGAIYQTGKTVAQDLLGYKINYYFNEENSTDDRILLYAEISNNVNETILIKSTDIESFVNRIYTYADEAGIKQKAEISNVVDVIYNGKAKLNYSNSILFPSTGWVTLIDNNNDGKYDVIKLLEYANCVVQSINETENTVYDKYGSANKLVLDPNDKANKYILKNTVGKQIRITEIVEGDVLSYLKGEDVNGNFYDVTVIKNKVEGIIEETKTGTTFRDEKVAIKGNEYGISKGFYDSYGMPKIGDEGIFRLDIDGNIASLDKTGLDYISYAYLVKAQPTKNSLENRIEFKLFGSDGEFIYCKGTERMKIDGKTGLKGDKILMSLSDTLNSTDIKPQVISYDLNSKGEIYKIDTVVFNNGYETEDSLRMQYSGSGLKYKGSSLTFAAKFCMTPSTIIMNIPTDINDVTSFSIPTSRNFISDTPYTVSAYSSKVDSPTVNVVIANNIGVAPIDGDSPITIVEKVTQVINEDGETVYKLYGNAEGKEIQAVTSLATASLLSDILPGDAIRYGLDAKKQISLVSLVYSTATDSYKLSSNPSSSDFIALYRFIYGSVYSKSDGYIRVATDINHVTDQDLETYQAEKFKIILCEMSGGKVKISTGSVSDMVEYKRSGNDCSKVLIQTKYGDPKAIYIFKKV